MRYAVLIYSDDRAWAGTTAEQRQAYVDAHQAFHDAAQILDSAALTGVESATTLRRADDGSLLVTDGPFAESVEQVSGFYTVEAPDLDEMLRLAALLPPAYVLEIRPLMEARPLESWLDD